MRKAVCIAAAMVFLLSGCAKKQVAQNYRPALDRPFEMTGIVRQSEQEYLMHFSHQPQGSAQVYFEGPGELKGMHMSFDREEIKVEYEGLSFSFTPGSIPNTAPATQILNTIQAALETQTTTSITEGGILMTGEVNGSAFSLLLDEQDGKILMLEIPESELEMKPLSFQFVS